MLANPRQTACDYHLIRVILRWFQVQTQQMWPAHTEETQGRRRRAVRKWDQLQLKEQVRRNNGR